MSWDVPPGGASAPEESSDGEPLPEEGHEADPEVLAIHAELEAELRRLGASGQRVEGQPAGYTLLDELHRGGQGVVYRAMQHSTHRVVAIKLLLGGGLASSARLRRFQREIEIVATLDHPCIATVHDSGVTEDGRPYFVMEYVHGRPLDGRLGRVEGEEGRPTRELLAIFLEVCSAVHYAHQRGVLHRDLKPGNILVDRHGVPHVLDFGLAVVAREDDAEEARLTRTGEFMGTLAYASPEHVSGVAEEIDVRSDVYSLGVILYELLTGELPYPTGGSVIDTVRHIQSTQAPSLLALRRGRSRSGELDAALLGVDRDLDTILSRTLAKEKERRYQTVGELEEDIRRHLGGQPIHARGESTWYVLRKTVQRHRAVALAIAGVALVLLGATAVSTLAWRRSRVSAATALEQAERAEQIVAYLRSMLLAVSPEKSRGQLVTVREVLDEAAASLERPVEESGIRSPAARFELRRTIGQSYFSLLRFSDAATHFERALPLALELFGEESDEFLGIRVDLAWAYLGESEFRRAQDLATQALAGVETLGGVDGGEREHLLAQLQTILARTHASLEEYDEADACLAEVAEALRRSAQGPTADLARLYTDQGSLMLRRGDFEAARHLLLEARDVWQEIPSKVTGRAIVLQLLGDVERERADYASAREYFKRSLGLLQELYGPSQGRTFAVRAELASIAARMGDLGYAEEEAAQLLALAPSLEERSAFSARALHGLGNLLNLLADYGNAEAVLAQAIARYDGVFSQETFEKSAAIAMRGWVLLRLGRLSEARVLARQARENLERIGGLGTPTDATFRLIHSWVLLRSGKRSEAVAEAREGLAIRERYYPESHDLVIEAMADLGLFLSVSGELEEAETILRRARGLHDGRGGDPAPAYAQILDTLGGILRDQGRYGEARELLAKALELRRRLLSADHPDLAESLNSFAMFRYMAGERDEGIHADFLEALRIFEAQGQLGRAAWVCSNLGTWEADVTGDQAAAREWVDRAIEYGDGSDAHNHPLWGVILANRGTMALREGETEQAISFLERAWESISTASPSHPSARGILERLVQAYKEVGREEEAQALAREHGLDGGD